MRQTLEVTGGHRPTHSPSCCGRLWRVARKFFPKTWYLIWCENKDRQGKKNTSHVAFVAFAKTRDLNEKLFSGNEKILTEI